MKDIFTTALITILLTQFLSAQPKQWPKLMYQPWQINHAAIDYKYTYYEPEFSTDSSDGYNCFIDTPIRLKYVDGNHLYFAFAAFTDFDIEGYFLSKFNITTGKEEWRKAINMRNQANREMPVAIKVEDESVLVASLEKRGDYNPQLQLAFFALNANSGMVMRRFDKDTGSLLTESISNDSIYSYGIIPFGDKYSITNFVNNKLLFIGNDFKPGNTQTHFRFLDTTDLHISNQGSYVQLNSTKYVWNKLYSQDYDFSKGLLATHYDFVDKTKLGKFDLTGKLENESWADTTQNYSRGLNAIFADNQRFILNGLVDDNPFELPRNFYLIYDHNLNLINKIEPPYSVNGERTMSAFISTDGDNIFFSTLNKPTNFENGYGYTSLYKYNINTNMSSEVYKYIFTDSLRYANVSDFVEHEDKYIILFNESSLYYNEENEAYVPDPNARAYTIVSLDKLKLLSQKNINQNPDLRIYPNPVLNLLTFDSDQNPVDYVVHSTCAQTILRGKCKDNQIDVGQLVPGQYFITVTFSNGNHVTEKFAKAGQ